MNTTTLPKVLVVEDDLALNDAYGTILKSANRYDVITAKDGKEALELIAKVGDPEVILLDIGMPVLDGIGFLREFKPADHPETTIVVFSNYDNSRMIDEAYELGATRYVLKARATPKDLLHMVDGILAGDQE